MTSTPQQALLASNFLLQAVTEAQLAFTQGHPVPELLGRLLGTVLELTGSEYGFIGEVVPTPGEQPALKPYAFQQLVRTPEPRVRPVSESAHGLVLAHVQCLVDDVLIAGQPLLTNAPAMMPCEGRGPESGFEVRSFLGLPLRSHEGILGLVGLVNRPDGFDDALVAFLQPFLATSGSVLMGLRGEQRRRRTEEELRQAQKRLMATERLASLGMLTAGVAHEINNPLAYMLSNLNYVNEELSTLVQKGETLTGPRARDLMDALSETLSGSSRVRDIVKDLKLFSRASPDQSGPLDLHALLDSCVNMAWSEIKHRGKLVKDYGDVPRIHGNQSRLAQVFLNLLVNAAHALPAQGGASSEIRVSTRHEADVVMVAVRDTGVGIPEENLERMFEPFFTTKPPGEGTGLGLSICQEIVQAVGGRITVESQPGRGSTFRVFLPVSPLPLQTQASTQRSAP
jgi:signal transduction histidine kinase